MQGVHNLCEFTGIHLQLSKLLLKNIVRIDKAPMLVEQPHVVHVVVLQPSDSACRYSFVTLLCEFRQQQ